MTPDLRCPCQLPCTWCPRGQHTECQRVSEACAAFGYVPGLRPETYLTPPWPARTAADHQGRHIPVWLTDRTCRYLCPCECRQDSDGEPVIPPVAPAPRDELVTLPGMEQLDLLTLGGTR